MRFLACAVTGKHEAPDESRAFAVSATTTLRGFDVSHHQAGVDFVKAKAAGHAFVVIKATEGAGYVDPMFATNRRNAHAAGLTVGFYHFAGSSTAKKVYDAAAEAAWFVRSVGPLQANEFLVLDYEPAVPPANPVAWCKTWLDAVTAALGPRPLIYMNQSAMNAYNWMPVSAGSGLWLAKYDSSTAAPATCSCWPSAAMKQYSDAGTVPGVASTCDVNVFYGGATQLAAYTTPASEDNMPTAQEIAAAVWSFPLHSANDPRGDWGGADRLPAIDKGLADVWAQLLSTNPGTLNGDLRSDLAAKAQVLQQIQQALSGLQVPPVDASAVATALAGNQGFLAALAKAVNDDAAKRLQS